MITLAAHSASPLAGSPIWYSVAKTLLHVYDEKDCKEGSYALVHVRPLSTQNTWTLSRYSHKVGQRWQL